MVLCLGRRVSFRRLRQSSGEFVTVAKGPPCPHGACSAQITRASMPVLLLQSRLKAAAVARFAESQVFCDGCVSVNHIPSLPPAGGADPKPLP